MFCTGTPHLVFIMFKLIKQIVKLQIVICAYLGHRRNLHDLLSELTKNKEAKLRYFELVSLLNSEGKYFPLCQSLCASWRMMRGTAEFKRGRWFLIIMSLSWKKKLLFKINNKFITSELFWNYRKKIQF